MSVLKRRDIVGLGGIDFGYAAVEFVVVKVRAGVVVAVEFDVLGCAKRSLLLCVSRFFGKQSIAIRLGNLVIIRVDFAE